MLSIGLLALILLPVLVVGMGLVGSLLRTVILSACRNVRRPPRDWPEAIGRLVENVALGVAVIPIFYLLATLLGVSLDSVFAFALLGISVAVFLARVLVHHGGFGVPIRNPRASGGWVALAFVGAFVLIVADRLVAYAPHLVYTGNDIRLFTLITQLVESHGHFVSSWGNFAGPTWNVAQDAHLTFSGSEAAFAVLNAWVPWNAPQLVSAAIIVIGMLLPASAFVFIRALFPERSYSVPLFGALAYGVIAAYPLFFQDWGGIDEQVTWFLFPVALTVLLAYLRSPDRPVSQLIIAGVLFGGTVIVNPFPLFYIGLFLIAFGIATLLRREMLHRLLIPVGAFLGIGLLIASPLLYHELAGWQSFTSSVPAGYAGWNAFQTAVILKPGDLWGSIYRFLTLNTGFPWAIFLVATGWFGLVLHLRREKHAITLVGWLVGLLLLNSNGPFGLYLFRYPGWTMLYPDRLAELMTLPLSVGTGLLLASLFDRVRADSARPLVLQRRERRVASSGRAPLVMAVAFVSLLAIGGFASYQIAVDNVSTVQWGSTFTNQDAASFQWMESHIPASATVMVDAADSGTWIPEFSGIRVFPYLELINNVSVYDQAITIPSLFNTTHYGPALGLLHQYNISYVFFGERTGYGLVQGLTLAEFVSPSPVSDFVAHASTCVAPASNLSLNLSCNGDTVTFNGPILISISETHDGPKVGTAWVAIPAFENWTFVLHSHTLSWPGSWTANFSAVPLAAVLHSDHNAAVLGFYPLFLQLETAQSIRYQNETGTVPQLG